MATQPTNTAGADIVAAPSNDYRIRRYLIVLCFVACGGWFAYDGHVGWPRENARIITIGKEIEKLRADGRDTEIRKLEDERGKLKVRTDLDINIQKILGYTLPPLGIGFLIFALYNSRGSYRLKGNTLFVPGHAPIPLTAITSVDRTNWDRKGIAHLEYQLPNGKTGWARIDDFIYLRKPTDEIYDAIMAFTGLAAEDAEALGIEDGAAVEQSDTPVVQNVKPSAAPVRSSLAQAVPSQPSLKQNKPK